MGVHTCLSVLIIFIIVLELGAQQECQVDPAVRVNCGWWDITADQCLQRGCCYDEPPVGYWCFHKRAAAVGLWPLNARYGASDITGNGNYGTASGTQLATGPFGHADGAFQFSGTAGSYINIPNNGKLDVRYSYTILAHIFPTGDSGPIFNYVGDNGGWAVHFWQLSPQMLQSRSMGRYGYVSPSVNASVLQPNAWNYVGGRYDITTGIASIWNDGALILEKYTGVAQVATQYPIRVAVRTGDNRYFAGRIACLQLYNYAMTEAQIAAARYVCRGARACENEILSIQCPAGQRMNIVTALFGRTSAVFCPGVIHTTNCRSPTSLSVVRSSCQGKSSCSVLASSSMFGDPCPGTNKYLEVEFTCTMSGQIPTLDELPPPPPPLAGCSTGPPSYPCITTTCNSTAPYSNDDTCTYTCAPGCAGSPSTTVTCNNGIWYGQVPKCQRTCRDPPTFRCTTVSGCSAPYIDGETCTYNCNDTCGGSPSTMTRTCRRGLWYGEAWRGCFPRGCQTGPPSYPPCVEVVCGTPPPYDNGDFCGYTCGRNCTGVESTLVFCKNGNWDGTVPKCVSEPWLCGSPPTFDCATIIPGCSAPYTNGETCTYACDDGCSGSGAGFTTRTCIRGRWYGLPWKGCRKNCEAPPTFPCSVRSGCDSPYTSGETCTYQCDMYRGCTGSPPSTTRTCNDGTWVGPRWRGCHARKCGSPPTKRWASYTCDEAGSPYPSGTTCTYRCRPGCNARPDTSTEICYNGRWYTRPKRKWKCKKRCGEPPSPPCTKRFGCAPSYTYGESCSYRCYNKEGGYTIEVSGDPIRTCLPSGLWSGTDLICDCKDRKDCCRPDIIFVLDYSGSISDSEFQQMKDFVAALVERFDIGPLDAQVGVLRYNWNPIGPVIQLDTYDNKAALLDAIDDLPTTTGGGTRTGVALTYVATTMLSTGNRPNAPDVVIVLTDGFSADSVTGPASVLQGMGVQTFAIGVGSCVSDPNLYEIANCRDHVYKLADFRGLDGITYIIHKQICCDKPKVTCPENYVSFKGTCLRFSQPHDQQGFEQAQRTCQAEGSRLVVIKSAALDAFIDNQIQSIPLDNTWIGLSTPIPGIPDEWTDGSTLVAGDYSDWYMYQTDMAPGEFCADIRPGYGYTWNTDNCQVRKNYICEHVAAPCCPRPRTGVSDPGYTLSDDRTYSLSPPLQCDAPAEETLPDF